MCWLSRDCSRKAGGVNSSALLVGLHQRCIPVDLILFADTGGEQPGTYAYLPIMDQWLAGHDMPQITVVEYTDKDGDRLTLEQECLRSGTLPALAYGYKKCSLKHRIGPQDKFCNNYPPCPAAAMTDRSLFDHQFLPRSMAPEDVPLAGTQQCRQFLPFCGA